MNKIYLLHLLFLSSIVACTNNENQVIHKIPEEKIPIISENIQILESKKIISLSNRDYLCFYSYHDSVTLDSCINIKQLKKHVESQGSSKMLKDEFINYFFNESTQKLYVLTQFPYTVDDTLFEGKKANYHKKDYYLFQLDRNFKISEFFKIKLDPIVLKNDSINQRLIPFARLGFFSNDSIIKYSLVSENANIYPFYTYHYIHRKHIEPKSNIPDSVIPYKQSSNSFEHFRINFVTMDSTVIFGDAGKIYTLPSRAIYDFDDFSKETINNKSDLEKLNNSFFNRFGDSLQMVSWQVSKNEKQYNAVTKSSNYYYFSSISIE